MEVVFRSDKGPFEGLRLLNRSQLDYLCMKAKCTIVSHRSNAYIDSYVLSESSLFIYRHRLIMKTCGTTTLLRCLSSLFEFTDALGMELAYLGYSRKNLTYPSAQHWPHSSFDNEITYLSSKEAGLDDRLRGNGHILGPITGDHWFVYIADHIPYTAAAMKGKGYASSPVSTPVDDVAVTCDDISLSSTESSPKQSSKSSASASAPSSVASAGMVPPIPRNTASYSSLNALTTSSSNERTFNMMMFDMDPTIAATFFSGKNGMNGKEMTMASGINKLCPGALIDDLAFQPCGYSMNAILHDAYYTIHITPEESCSYVSFETNTLLDDYRPLLRNVLMTFKPRRFVVTMFGDTVSIESLKLSSLPTSQSLIEFPSFGNYRRTSSSSTQVDLELYCLMGCYNLMEDSESKGRRMEIKSEMAVQGSSSSDVALMQGTLKKNEFSFSSASASASSTTDNEAADSSDEDSCNSGPCVVEDDSFRSQQQQPFASVTFSREKKERSFTWC
jgi:hypothetical protein